MKRKNIYCEIAKFEKQEDGTLIVSGFASTGEKDSDGEVITPDAMKAALPDYMKFGAVREMHQASAAGTALEAQVNDAGQTEFTAHVVDPVAVLKVETNVYKGFSIGGKVTERDPDNKKVIKGLNLVEVSLVDRPANPGAVFTMYKAEGIDSENAVEELAELLDAGLITPQRLVELAKTEQTGQVEPQQIDDATKALQPDGIKKGMWSVSDFAGVLSSIGWIAQDAQFEAEYEGDNSPIPAQLRQWLKDGAAIFQAMAAEESAELVAQLSAQAGEVEEIVMSAKVSKALESGDIAKAGAKFSAATKSALKAAHDACKAADKALADLGYDKEDDDDDGDTGKAALGDDLKKAAAAHDELLKACAAIGCKEGEIVVDFVKALAVERDTLKKRVSDLEAKPAPGKALLKAIAIGKGDDIGSEDDVNKVTPVADSSGTQNEVATLIKAAHAQGGFVMHT